MKPIAAAEPDHNAVNKLFLNAHFLVSAPNQKGLLPDHGSEVAFCGRSNAGKSSAINALVQRRRLAHTSRTPGHTQLINFFGLDEQATKRLVDLPGYGYAKVPISVQKNWRRLLEGYFSLRESLAGLILLVDSRRGLKPADLEFLSWIQPRRLPILILMTKADKLNRNAQKQALLLARKQTHGIEIQLFSSLTGLGVEQTRRKIGSWLRQKS